MQCWQVIDSLPDFVADRLPSVQAAALDAHLASCDSCWSAYLAAQAEDADLQVVEEALADPGLARLVTTEPPPLPEGWTAHLLDQIDWAPPKPVRWWTKALRHPVVSGTYAAAAAILVFSVAQRVFLWQTTTNGLGALFLQGELWLAALSNRLFEVGAWASDLLANLF
jgi:anti-sigma factor RsiW